MIRDPELSNEAGVQRRVGALYGTDGWYRGAEPNLASIDRKLVRFERQ